MTIDYGNETYNYVYYTEQCILYMYTIHLPPQSLQVKIPYLSCVIKIRARGALSGHSLLIPVLPSLLYLHGQLSVKRRSDLLQQIFLIHEIFLQTFILNFQLNILRTEKSKVKEVAYNQLTSSE